MSTRSGESGFSLVEMLVVLAMVAMVGAALGAALRPLGQASARDVARSLAAEARNASRMAAATGRTAFLRVDLAERAVSIDAAPPRLRIPQSYSVELSVADRLVQSGTVGEIAFFPDGSSTGGDVTIASGPSTRYKVRVFWLTGDISVGPAS